MDKEGILLRFNELYNWSGLNQSEFSKHCDINQGNLSKLLSGGRPIGKAVINKVMLAFDINRDWFLHGKGPMTNIPASDEIAPVVAHNVMLVPLVQQYAYAGYLCGYADPEYVVELPKMPFLVDREYKGNYLCFEIRGDSMDDGSKYSYEQGDIVLAREIRQEYWKSKLHLKQWSDYVVVHKTEGILIKQIIEHNVERGLITIHSLNPLYPDREIFLGDVSMLFNVVKSVKSK